MGSLLSQYDKKKRRIKERLKEFKNIHKGKESDIFEELCFCLLTPQSKAIACGKAVKELKKSGKLFKGSRRDIRKGLSGVRFPNNKADYIITARRLFKRDNKLNIKDTLDAEDPFKTREYLVDNVKGLGYKEASHFLRNIGLGRDLAILDMHILKNLKRCGVIRKIPVSIDKKNYLCIEGKMREFSKRIKIPLDELDLLFWSLETGLIFK